MNENLTICTVDTLITHTHYNPYLSKPISFLVVDDEILANLEVGEPIFSQSTYP